MSPGLPGLVGDLLLADTNRAVFEKTIWSIRESTKTPISVPVSPSSAVKCYPCREVPLNYKRSLLFHGGDTGSTPVGDAKIPQAIERFDSAPQHLQRRH